MNIPSRTTDTQDSNCLGHSNTVSNAKIHPAFMQPQSAEEEMAIQKEWGNEVCVRRGAVDCSGIARSIKEERGEEGVVC